MVSQETNQAESFDGMPTEAQRLRAEQNPVYQTELESKFSHESYERLLEGVKQAHPLVVAMMDLHNVDSISHEQLATRASPVISETLKRLKLEFSPDERQAIEAMLLVEMIGFGPIDCLMQDDSVNDILINTEKQVYVERFGKLQLTNIKFWDRKHLFTIITRVLSRINRRVDETVPYVNARMPDGSRVNVVLPPLSPDGPLVSIRKFNFVQLTLDEMVANGCLSSEMAKFLMIATNIKLNIIITGGAGSGKTTLLNAIMRQMDVNERIITIEDIAELNSTHPHTLKLESREANIEGNGKVSLQDLFVNALRMRPDRIIVGEARGAEVFDMLQAMNTGHDGSLSTLHASIAEEVPIRVANMVSLTGFQYPVETTMRQFSNCIDVIVEIQRLADGRRVVNRIAEVLGMENGHIQMQDLFRYEYTRTPAGEISGHFEKCGVEPSFLQRAERFGLAEQLLKLVKHA